MIFLHNLAVSKLPYSRKCSRGSNFWTVGSISILDSSSLSNRSVLSPWLWVSAIFLLTLWGIKSREKDWRAMSWTKISRFNGNSQKSVPAKIYPIAVYAIPYTCMLSHIRVRYPIYMYAYAAMALYRYFSPHTIHPCGTKLAMMEDVTVQGMEDVPVWPEEGAAKY